MVLAVDIDILGEVKPFFAFGKELKGVSPLISYRCEWLGVKLGLSLLNTQKGSDPKLIQIASQFISQKLNELPKIRAALIPKDMTKDEVKQE